MTLDQRIVEGDAALLRRSRRMRVVVKITLVSDARSNHVSGVSATGSGSICADAGAPHGTLPVARSRCPRTAPGMRASRDGRAGGREGGLDQVFEGHGLCCGCDVTGTARTIPQA